MNEELIEAIAFGSVTLVGYFGNFPRKHGNCFSVKANDEKYYRILNFNHENLTELIKRETVSFPIKISVLKERFAVIVDGRIPNEWYSRTFCENCCPRDLLPAPQRINQILDIQRGIRTETKMEMNGEVFYSIGYNIKSNQPGYIYTPYIVEQAQNIEILCDQNFNSKEINKVLLTEITITKKDEGED